jgi:hypothetical protein
MYFERQQLSPEYEYDPGILIILYRPKGYGDKETVMPAGARSL